MNIYDIANEAGVSIATVSRVINNKPNVSSVTREKVQQILTRSDFVPSSFARGLVTKRNNVVGILTIDMRVPHYANTIYALEAEMHNHGFQSVICNTSGDIDKGNTYLRMLYDSGACGAVLVGSVFQNTFPQTSLMNANPSFFYLMINCEMSIGHSCSVMLDDKAGAQMVIDHLVERGHANIVYVQDADSQSGIRKKNYFLESMLQHRLDCSEKHVFKSPRTLDGGSLTFDSIMRSKLNPTAIFVGDDLTAVGLVKRAEQLGIRVPDDIAFVGYNNSRYGLLCSPSLTTVDSKNDLIASCAVMLMSNMVASRETTRVINVRPELVIREST